MRLALLLLLVGCGARTALDVGRASDAAVSDDAPRTDVTTLPLCTSGLVKIADTGPAPDEILLDGAFVYWHEGDGIARAPKVGGAAQSLATHGSIEWPAMASLALSADYAYFTQDEAGQVAMVSKQGGAAALVPMIPTQPFPRIVIDSTTLYAWSDVGMSGPLFAMPLGGGPTTQIATLPTGASKLIIEGGRAFTATNAGVQVVDLQTGNVTFLSGLGAADIATDATDVYFTTIDITNGTRVMRVPKGGGNGSGVLQQVGSHTLAVNATDLYFGDRADLAVKKAVGKAGTNIALVAQLGPSLQPIGIALDADCIYIVGAPTDDATAPGAIFAAPH